MPSEMLHACALARRIENGELTPRDVIERAAEAIAAKEETIGAFAALDLDRARRDAEQADVSRKPLRGLPVAYKDIYDTADFVTSYGSAIYDGHRPAADAALVAMTRRAGGVALGKTVTTDFAHLDPGKTRNPHNPEHTPGGSSSGSAAAVAAGMVAVATGSQTGGSIIRPASFCGVAGYKPSFALLPTVGMKCVSWHLDTGGLFAASVEDVAFAAGAISGRPLAISGQGPATPRIALLRRQPWDDASVAMMKAVESAARAAEREGAILLDIELPDVMADAFHAHGQIQSYEAARSLASEYDRHGDALRATLRELIEKGLAVSHDEYDRARGISSRARRSAFDIFADIDVIVSPSAPGAAPRGLQSTGSSTFNRLWTLLGVPCVSIPGARDAEGLPLGIQAIGRFGLDRETLQVADFIERAMAAR